MSPIFQGIAAKFCYTTKFTYLCGANHYLSMKINLYHFIAAWMLLACAIPARAYTLLRGSIDDSAIFPGTVHTYAISIPEGYTGNEPACLFLAMDGITCNAPARLDSLIADGDIPITIGVYLQPGVVYGSDGEVIRYNRSNEFDATDDRFAAFLETELLPAVARRQLDDGRPVLISDNPSDRCIFGLSSGGIASLNAAWQRPDLFGRVYSGCGTFVPMRGGHDLEAIIRKHEPKPLRIFIQDGYSDTWNPTFGSWYEHNVLVGSALQFAGYDCAFDWTEGGHSFARTNAIFRDMMKWLWSNPVEVGTTANNTLAPILEGCPTGWTPGGAVDVDASMGTMIPYPDNRLAAVREISDGHIDQCVIDDGNPVFRQRFYWPHSYNNNDIALGGMAFDSKGLLWAVTDSGIQIFDHNGRVRGIIELPLEIKKEHTAADYGIRIDDGKVTLSNSRQSFSRPFHVSAPEPGATPQSQGAA